MDLKFVSHGLWSEEQNILLQNNLKHENEAGGGVLSYSASFSCEIVFTFISQNSKFFFIHVFKKEVLLI